MLALPGCELTLPGCELTLSGCELTLPSCELTLPGCELTLRRLQQEFVNLQLLGTLLPILYYLLADYDKGILTLWHPIGHS